MAQSSDRGYFIVKHDLGAFEALPQFIWNTHTPETKVPRGYNQVNVGDVWIAFAYIASDDSDQPLSLITGFYECVRAREYRKIPPFSPKTRPPYIIPFEPEHAWLIEGKEYGKQPERPVDVPPIDKLLDRDKPTWPRATLIRICSEEFEKVRKETFAWQEALGRVPLFGRAPKSEQELLCAVVAGHRELGIEKIISVQARFPDLCVKMAGVPQEVHLELEIYASEFQGHGHAVHVKEGKVQDGKFKGADVGILCWIDNLKKDDDPVRKCVNHRVYEFESLLREGRKICWDSPQGPGR